MIKEFRFAQYVREYLLNEVNINGFCERAYSRYTVCCCVANKPSNEKKSLDNNEGGRWGGGGGVEERGVK